MSSEIPLRVIALEISLRSNTKISMKISYLKFHSSLPGAIELITDIDHLWYSQSTKLSWTTYATKSVAGWSVIETIHVSGKLWVCNEILIYQINSFVMEIEGYCPDVSKGCKSSHADHAHVPLTHKHRETHGCVVSTVTTDALVLKH